MKKYCEVLRKCTLFEGVDPETLLLLPDILGAVLRTFEKGQAVFCEGDAAGQIGIVLSGKVQIEQTDYFGVRSIAASLEDSEIFGETFACSGMKSFPVDVTAAERAEVLLLDYRRILMPGELHGRLIYNLMRAMAGKNLLLRRKLEIAGKRTTRDKLMTYLLQQAKKNGGGSFEIPFDRQGLADYLGVDRSGLSSEIGRLRSEGVLTSEKNRFVLL